MSNIKCVACEVIAFTPPELPAGTMAAFATILPSEAFSVETPGCGAPAPHSVKKPNGAGGTTVAFKEYACAAEGTLLR